MVSAVVTVHVIVCIALCIVILLQQGKGADIGAVFGGSSQTVFGAGGAGNALSKATWSLAAIFFATSIFLAFASARRVSGSIFDRPFSKPFSAGASSVMPPVKKMPLTTMPAAPAAGGSLSPGNAATPAPKKP